MKITYLLLAFAPLAFAEPAPPDAVAKMAAQSEFYMGCGLCKVENGPFASAIQTLIFPAPVGMRRITAGDYNWIKQAGDAKGTSGKYLMTERVEQSCRADWTSSRCYAARALWRQEWPTGECVGTDGKVVKASLLRINPQ